MKIRLKNNYYCAFLVVGMAAGAMQTGYAATLLTDGLIAHWSFDTNFNATQGSSSYNLTTLGTGGPVIDTTKSRFGGASAKFVRANSQYLQGSSPFPNSGTNRSYSFSAWYFLDLADIPVGTTAFDSPNRYEVLSATKNDETTFPASYAMRDTGSGDIGQVYGNFTSSPTNPNFSFNPGAHQAWRNIIVTYDNSVNTMTAWLDGLQVGTTSVSGTLTQSDVIRIGNGRISNRYWDGWIDDVAVWNRVLTTDEIASIQTSPIPEPTASFLVSLGLFFFLLRRRK